MSGFGKRSPSGHNKVRRPVPPKETRQNPQRWRQAFGELQPLDSAVQAKSETVSRNLYAGLPEPVATSNPLIKFGDTHVGGSTSQRRTLGLLASDKGNADGAMPQQTQAEAEIPKNPPWRSTVGQVRSKPETDIFRSATPPPAMTGDRELDDLVGKPAHSADDRYRVLDSLDKIIRKRNPKVKVRVEFAVTLAGTCPDMCPEKERYMREVQRRLSPYECDSSQQDAVVDHQLAIKEYSRSSADQEEPLPHDLRPIQSLHLTFDYLLHNIISRMEDENESLSDLYFFIWDRTRALRKDMTQQQLGSTDAVLLMEKCVRFHIYCSTRLCELDRHSFDPKLNDENLMKCLQSLEHMYADLLPLGVECPNEPEFRAYQILMHLNEGDIVREIQQKPDKILKSGPVQHALKIYVALNSMNSVAFFRLVEKSSFMVSCILHRYFFQVRTNALRRFLKTFSLKNVVTIPTMQVKRMLGFGSGDENINTFKFFCESHGFNSPNIGPVSITMRNRNEFEQPEFNLINREFSLIESKLTCSVSEVINGRPLGRNPLESYVPQSSFDENGFFKRELLESLKLTLKPAPAPYTPPQAHGQTAVTSPSVVSLSSKVSPIASDIRNRLGSRLGPTSGDPLVKIRPMGSSDSSSSSETGSGFSFLSSLPSAGPNFAQPFSTSKSAPLPNFSFTTALTATGQPKFSFTPSSERIAAPSIPSAAGFSFGLTDSQKEEAVRFAKGKEEQKQRMVIEFRDELAQNILQEVVTKEVRQVATVVRQENVVREAKEALQKSLSQQIYKQLETEEIKQAIHKSASHEFSKAQHMATTCVKIESDLRNGVVLEQVKAIAQDVYKQLKAEEETRIKKLDEICRRIRLRHWVISWKNAIHEMHLARIAELKRQQWNVENFPPILTAQYPAVTILREWSAGVLPLAEKPSHESYSLDLFERAMQVKRSFEKHIEESNPSILHHLTDPLLARLSGVPPLPRLCVEWQPPVAVNIVLCSEFGPWDYLANWTWNSFQEDSVPLRSANYCAHRLSNDSNIFITFQKCTDLEESASIDSLGILFFHSTSSAQTAKKNNSSALEKLRNFAAKNPSLPVVIFNSTSSTEFEIKFHSGLVEPESCKVIEVMKGQHVVENIPALAEGLQWMGQSLEIGPPLEPPVILLPFSKLVETIFREVYPMRYKGAVCPSHLYEGHNDLVRGLESLVENESTLGVLKKWPGRATKLLIQKFSKEICFAHEAGMLSVVIKNLKELERLLYINPPEDLIRKWHQGQIMGQTEVTAALKDEIAKLTENYSISDNLRTRFNFVLALQRKERSIPWREFLEASQECALEKLSTVGSSTYQVCVDLRHIQNLVTLKPNLPRCPSCCGISGRKRGFSLDPELALLISSPKCKTVCKDAAAQNLLQSMQSLLQGMKEEKEELETSFSELQNSFNLDT